MRISKQLLRHAGYVVNRKRVQRLMRKMGLAEMAPGPNTSRAHPRHPVYPYLLRGLVVEHPNQVWSTDITYIRLAQGFAYLVAIMDWYRRKVLSWQNSERPAKGNPEGEVRPKNVSMFYYIKIN
ncbi:MAG: putative transposase [Candidatus Kentron sp. G]|nr:MAG: putative transposase [Candidatus Kentron sp. G]